MLLTTTEKTKRKFFRIAPARLWRACLSVGRETVHPCHSERVFESRNLPYQARHGGGGASACLWRGNFSGTFRGRLIREYHNEDLTGFFYLVN